MGTGQDLDNGRDPILLDPGHDPLEAVSRRLGNDRTVRRGAPPLVDDASHLLNLPGFVFEYLVLPQIAGARKTVHLLGQVNVAWLAAGLLLVREAGGYVTDLDGGEAMLKKGHIVAGNESMHRGLLQLVNGAVAA